VSWLIRNDLGRVVEAWADEPTELQQIGLQTAGYTWEDTERSTARPEPYLPPAGGTVVPVSGMGAFVASRSTHGAWWLVTEHGCPCPATIERCYHVRAVADFTRKLDEENRARDRARLGTRPPHPGLVD